MTSFWQLGLTLLVLLWAVAYVGHCIYKALTIRGSSCGGCGGCANKRPPRNLVQLARKSDS
ncbi:MAG: hypothetical protein Q8M16_24825 [Pirellulaceae bacterium]|nr:hypothetical protein [Pirellulaceae bacterium]